MSRPICDPILKELKGPTKGRRAYWRRFCKVDIITSYHYIIVGDTYKGHTNATIIEANSLKGKEKEEQKTTSTIIELRSILVRKD